MLIEMMIGKIHRATVTDANLNYVGSITIDKQLMRDAGILEYQKVLVVNINNGARFETYAMEGAEGSGVICLNGAAARHAAVGDLVIILAFGLFEKDQLVDFTPNIVLVDSNNRGTPIAHRNL